MMDASEVAKPGGGAKLGKGAFGDAGHRRSVVGEVLDGGVSEISDGGHDCQLCQQACVLKVAVGHGAASWSWTSSGNAWRQRYEVVPSKKTPPMPGLAASVAPRKSGSSGIISAR